MIIVGLAGYFVAFAALNAPDADWVRLLSFVPFFSPYLLPIRMVTRTHRAMGVGGRRSSCSSAGVAVALWVAGRIYSAGVLLYGQRAGLRSVWRAVRVNR